SSAAVKTVRTQAAIRLSLEGDLVCVMYRNCLAQLFLFLAAESISMTCLPFNCVFTLIHQFCTIDPRIDSALSRAINSRFCGHQGHIRYFPSNEVELRFTTYV